MNNFNIPQNIMPLAFNLEQFAQENSNFRIAVWTGQHLQMTLMSIPVKEDIGLEKHKDTDQIICIKDGQALSTISRFQNSIEQQYFLNRGDVIFIPAGFWHNIINTGMIPLKLISVYAPPNHAPNTIHLTKADAMKEEH